MFGAAVESSRGSKRKSDDVSSEGSPAVKRVVSRAGEATTEVGVLQGGSKDIVQDRQPSLLSCVVFWVRQKVIAQAAWARP